MKPIITSLLLGSLSLLITIPLAAHDFWLEPSTFRAQLDDQVSLTLRVGENLKGDTLPYINGWFSDYRVVSDTGERPIEGIMGDDPAGRFVAETPGIHLVGYRSTNSFVELESQKFHDYLAKEGLESVIAIRNRRGDADSAGREDYSRCAKTLVSVGDAWSGNTFNKALGFTLELIPERNPYAMSPGESLPIQLLYLAEPIKDVLVIAFTQNEPEQKVSARTDASGRVNLQLGHPGVWLVKAVHIIETPPDDDNADWESFWASLTFRLDS
jgi:uncharacterized GH25 family protein